MTENIPQIVEAPGNPRRINTKKISPRHIIVKLLKPKDRVFPKRENI